MVDENEIVQIKRADLRALLAEMQRGVAADDARTTDPAPYRGATGRDAEIYRAAAQEAFDRVKRDFERDLRDMVREATKDFLSQSAIEKKIEDAFDDIGLPMDKEHRRETAEAMRGMVKWQKRIDKVLGGMALAVVTAALYALAKLAGINLPYPSGSK